ncbi:MAG: hypothetical protein U9N86_01075 [Bacteroidota bacterium]|nr:hypothetical protein [Bacteroidota bacterium]
MEQKDFLVRQLEMIGPTIMYMLGIWKDGRISDAIDYGAEHIEGLTSIPLRELDMIHQDKIVEHLAKIKEISPGIIRITAEFLYRIGEIRHLEGHPNGRETLLKAQNLLVWHEEFTGIFSFDVQSMKNSIIQMLTGN